MKQTKSAKIWWICDNYFKPFKLSNKILSKLCFQRSDTTKDTEEAGVTGHMEVPVSNGRYSTNNSNFMMHVAHSSVLRNIANQY